MGLSVLAAHRGATDAAGTDWKSAVYRKVEEEVKAGRGLTIERMVELARSAGPASTASMTTPSQVQIRIWIYATQSSELRWSGPATAGRGSRRNCVAVAG